MHCGSLNITEWSSTPLTLEEPHCLMRAPTVCSPRLNILLVQTHAQHKCPTHRPWLGHSGYRLRHCNGTGLRHSQVEFLGLCDLGLGLQERNLIGWHSFQLVDQLLDLWLPS